MTRSICAVFDIDDTLYLERDYVHSGFESVGRWAAKWLDIKDFGDRCWIHFVDGQRKSIFDHVLQECRRDPAPEVISALVEIYRTHQPSISLAPDAADALSEIRGTTTIAVISDGPAVSQRRKSEALGLCRVAAPIVLTGELGKEFCKPHPAAFQYVVQCCPASVYVYIADNPLKDFAAPEQLGWTTIRVRRPKGLHYAVNNSGIAPDHEMSDCSGVREVLSQL